MLDYLFISPLGWSSHVWDKLITNKKFSNKTYSVINFIDDSFTSITADSINKKITENLDQLKSTGCVITSSYGTVAFLAYLSETNRSITNLIIIDGLDKLPNQKEIYDMFNQDRNITFSNKIEYYNDMLSDDEKSDHELLNILNYNLIKKEKVYSPILSNKNTSRYLSLYASTEPIKLLNTVLPSIKKLKIFSHNSLNIDFELISEDEHLLMLKRPDVILKEI